MSKEIPIDFWFLQFYGLTPNNNDILAIVMWIIVD